MNSFDELTGDATRTTDTLNVQLINANGSDIGGGGTSTAQVNKFSLPSVSASQAQFTQATVTASGADNGLITFTYGGVTGTALSTANDATLTGAALASSINGVAGQTVAYQGSSDSSVTNTSGTATLTGVTISGLVVGMSVTGTGVPANTRITNISSAASGTVTLSNNTTAGVTAANFGGGAGGVTIIAPTPGVPLSFGITSVTGSNTVGTSLIAPNVAGNIGSTVGVNYNGTLTSYIIGADVDTTAVALKDALNAAAGGTATAQVVDNGSNDYVELTAAIPGVPLPTITFSGSAGNLPTQSVTTANVTAASTISFGSNTGLDIINLTNTSGSAATVNALSTPGATTFRSSLSTNNLSFTNLSNNALIALRGNGSLTTGGLKGTYATSATNASVSIENGTTAGAVDIDGSGITTVAISSVGAANTVGTFDVAGAKTISLNAATGLTLTALSTSATDASFTISGAGAVSLGQFDDGIISFNASTNTGGITATAAGNSPNAVYILSSGNDKFTTDDDGFASTDKFSVDAGAGTNTLVVAAAADVNTADEAVRYKNFQVLQAGDLNTNLDVSLFTTSQLSAAVLGDTGLTGMSATLAGNININANNASSTFALSTSTGTSDVLSVVSAAATSTAAADLSSVTVNGFETLNFTVNSGDADIAASTDRAVLSFASSGAANLTTINIAGTRSVNLNAASNVNSLTAINASAIQGGAIISTGSQTGLLTITGSAVADEITTNAVGTGGTLSINLGAGNDTVKSTTSIVKDSSTIVGGTGTDTLQFSDTVSTTATLTVADSTFRNVTGVDVIEFTGAASLDGDLVWILGGFADNLATSVGGTLGIKIASGLTAAADDLTLDASALTGANAINADIVNTMAATSQASDISVTGANGSDTIRVEEKLASAASIITVKSGSGNDNVTIVTTASQAGALVVEGGLGDDKLDLAGATSDAAVTSNLVTGGGGDDNIILDSEGSNTKITVITEATASANGIDRITNFTQGSSEDVLKIDAFLDATALNSVLTANQDLDATSDVNRLVDIAGGADITTAAGLNAALSAGGEYSRVTMNGSSKAVFVTAKSDAANQDQFVFYATSDASGNVTTQLVAIMSGLDVDSWAASNFNI
jgi:hypothetical protein